jgi:hypothetical protein
VIHVIIHGIIVLENFLYFFMLQYLTPYTSILLSHFRRGIIVYIKHQSACPFVRIGSPHLLPRKGVLLPPSTQVRGRHTHVRGRRILNSDEETNTLMFFFFRTTVYSALFHLPPLRFHCADGCWDRTQDRCNWCIGSQTL